jgi:hypothetical protein
MAYSPESEMSMVLPLDPFGFMQRYAAVNEIALVFLLWKNASKNSPFQKNLPGSSGFRVGMKKLICR